MSLEDLNRERAIRSTLRALARQRVAIVLQPGNVWVVERAIQDTDRTAEHLRTCHLRGWVEPVESAVPHGRLTAKGEFPPGDLYDSVKPVYRLTEGGWAVLNRSHGWVIATFVVAIASLAVGSVTVWLMLKP